MNYFNIIRVLGLLLIFFSPTMITPIIVDAFFDDGNIYPFIRTFFISLGLGLFLWVPTYNFKRDLRTKEGFLVVVLFWLSLSLIASLPFLVFRKIFY